MTDYPTIADIEFDLEGDTSPMQRMVLRACSCSKCGDDLLPHDFPLPESATDGWHYQRIAGWQRSLFYVDGSNEYQTHYSPLCLPCFRMARGSKVRNGKMAKGSATAGAYTTMARPLTETTLRSA